MNKIDDLLYPRWRLGTPATAVLLSGGAGFSRKPNPCSDATICRVPIGSKALFSSEFSAISPTIYAASSVISRSQSRARQSLTNDGEDTDSWAYHRVKTSENMSDTPLHATEGELLCLYVGLQ